MSPGFIPAHGKYRQLLSYQKAEVVYDTRAAEVVANIAICLIHQANFLLDKQIRRLQQDFVKEGGLRERMTRARLQFRNQSHRTHSSQPSAEKKPE